MATKKYGTLKELVAYTEGYLTAVKELEALIPLEGRLSTGGGADRRQGRRPAAKKRRKRRWFRKPKDLEARPGGKKTE